MKSVIYFTNWPINSIKKKHYIVIMNLVYFHQQPTSYIELNTYFGFILNIMNILIGTINYSRLYILVF